MMDIVVTLFDGTTLNLTVDEGSVTVDKQSEFLTINNYRIGGNERYSIARSAIKMIAYTNDSDKHLDLSDAHMSQLLAETNKKPFVSADCAHYMRALGNYVSRNPEEQLMKSLLEIIQVNGPYCLGWALERVPAEFRLKMASLLRSPEYSKLRNYLKGLGE